VSVPQARGTSLGTHFVGRIVLAMQDLPAVPHSAVLSDDKGSYVFRVVKGKAQRIAVQPALETDRWIGIASGLSAGDTVVTLGNYELTDGMAVRVAGG
jgi:multidrug efflux pump subunit AcrA (membrane-fusion protein)